MLIYNKHIIQKKFYEELGQKMVIMHKQFFLLCFFLLQIQ
jgi:hypothetical protein